MQGEAVNVDAYCLKLANTMGVHVMLFQDWDPFMYEKAYSWNQAYYQMHGSISMSVSG